MNSHPQLLNYIASKYVRINLIRLEILFLYYVVCGILTRYNIFIIFVLLILEYIEITKYLGHIT